MKKVFVIALVMCMLSVSMYGVVAFKASPSNSENVNTNYGVPTSVTETSTRSIVHAVNQYMCMDENYYNHAHRGHTQDIDLPQIGCNGEIFGWWIRLDYDGKTFEKQLNISISDFTEKFLKHPEYGKIVKFNVDNDPEDDVEVIVGFYWSVIGDVSSNGNLKSLEMRLRVHQLPKDSNNGGNTGIEDIYGDFTVWSELHVNIGLIKNKAVSKSVSYGFQGLNDQIKDMQIIGHKPGLLIWKLINRIFRNKDSSNFVFGNLLDILSNSKKWADPTGRGNIAPLTSDDDYFSIGSGFHSPSGEKIPLFAEKKFSFAKDITWNPLSIFSPAIFQHKMDPGGEDPIELLYGFQSYKAGDTKPTYDIAFSVKFDPAVYLETKFVPLGGYVYYYFDQKSQKYSQTKVTFSADIIKGSGDDVPGLSLIFDRIDDNLGKSGQWMSFDLRKNGFEYKASHKFNVGIVVSIPDLFDEKVQIDGIPKNVNFDWDVDVDLDILPHMFDATFGGSVNLDMSSSIDKVTVYYPKEDPNDPDSAFIEINDVPSYERLSTQTSLHICNSSLLTVNVGGSIDLSMNSQPGEMNIYYPKADATNPDAVFINVPDGSIPSNVHIGTEAELCVDPDNLLNPSNHIYGRVYHSCNSNIRELGVYLIGEENPVVKITDIPAAAEVRGELYWAKLEGYAYASRGYIGGIDPVEVNLGYGGFNIYNRLEIRDGYIYTNFKVAKDGYFRFDTSKKMFGNILHVADSDTGDELGLSVDEVSADNLRADWNIDTSGDKIKFNSLNFGGIVDTLKGFQLDLNYKGKSAELSLDWTLGGEGGINIDFHQDNNVQLNFDLGNESSAIDLHGYVVLPNNPHFDMSWKWKQGTSSSDPGFFRINKDTNEPLINDLYLYFTYQDTWGAEATVRNAGVYIDVTWYWYNLLLYIWPVVDIYAEDWDLNLLLNGEWHYNIEDLSPP